MATATFEARACVLVVSDLIHRVARDAIRVVLAAEVARVVFTEVVVLSGEAIEGFSVATNTVHCIDALASDSELPTSCQRASRVLAKSATLDTELPVVMVALSTIIRRDSPDIYYIDSFYLASIANELVVALLQAIIIDHAIPSALHPPQPIPSTDVGLLAHVRAPIVLWRLAALAIALALGGAPVPSRLEGHVGSDAGVQGFGFEGEALAAEGLSALLRRLLHRHL